MLILASYSGRKPNDSGTQWLEELQYKGGPVLKLPTEQDQACILVGTTRHNAMHKTFDSTNTVKRHEPKEPDYSPRRPADKAGTRAPLPYFLQPSSLTKAPVANADVTGVKLIDIGERISTSGTVDMTLLGECVHSFLAVNNSRAERCDQLEFADRVRMLWQVDQIQSTDLLLISSRFDQFLDREFRVLRRYDECPVTARMNSQRLRGFIDVLLETEEGFHIIDHKTFPGPTEQWATKALSYLAQLQAYKFAIEQATAKTVHRLLIHMPIIGKVLELRDDSMTTQPKIQP